MVVDRPGMAPHRMPSVVPSRHDHSANGVSASAIWSITTARQLPVGINM